MAKRKRVSFDGMVKYFLKEYDVPTKKDVDKLMAKLDRLEHIIRKSALSETSKRVSGDKLTSSRMSGIASDVVLEIIKNFENGVGFADIQAKTGFGEKKLRNIIYRLNKLNKIACKSRGLYIPA